MPTVSTRNNNFLNKKTMKTKFIFSLLTALLFNFTTSGMFAQSIGIDHNLMFGIQMGLSLIPLQLTGCLAEGLNKEIWIPEIIENSILKHRLSLIRGISVCGRTMSI